MGKGQRTLAPRRRLAGAAFKPPCGAAAGNDAVLSGQGKGKQNLSGSCCEDERKQTPDEASKQKCLHQNQCIRTALGSVWRLPVYRPYGARCKGGMSTTRGFYRELEKQPDGVGAVYEEIRLWRTDS